MSYTAVLEVEYGVESEEEARDLARRDAGHLIQLPDVLAVAAGPKIDLPITERYLQDEPHFDEWKHERQS